MKKKTCKRCKKKREIVPKEKFRMICDLCLRPLEIQLLQDLKLAEHQKKYEGKRNKV